MICESNNINGDIEIKKILEKHTHMFDVTVCNYTNMLKRLRKQASNSNIVLIYYSMFLIFTSITNKYFPQMCDNTIVEYFNIIFSVIILIFSLIIKNSKFPERINEIEESIKEIKYIRSFLCEENLEESKNKYRMIVGKTEMRKDVDFFKTVKSLCKRYDIIWYNHPKKIEINEEKLTDYEIRNLKRIKKYLADINVFVNQSNIIINNLIYFFIFTLPIIIFFICII